MIAAALILLAAICKAIADTLDHHFDLSVFKNKPRSFWDPNIVHKTGKQIFGYPIDAWHLLNSAMIVCFITAIAIHKPVLAWYFEIPIGGVWFIVVFNTFYNRMWKPLKP